ncbi:hypothetical protein SaSA20_0679a [Streptococcus agalactiae]|nr:hypothetical protein SaSA20_0679a [Streptococcus agalactiae]
MENSIGGNTYPSYDFYETKTAIVKKEGK